MSDEKIAVYVDIDLEDLIPRFLDNRQKDIKTLEDALEANNFSTLMSVGHNLKGVGGGYGFPDITKLGAAIEENAKINNAEGIKENIRKLSHYLSNVDVIYEEG